MGFDHYSRLARSNNHNDALDSIFFDESLYTFIEVGPGLEHFVSLLILLDLSGDDCPASGQKCDFLRNLSSVKRCSYAEILCDLLGRTRRLIFVLYALDEKSSVSK